MDYNEFRTKISNKKLHMFGDLMRDLVKSGKIKNGCFDYIICKSDFEPISKRRTTENEMLLFIKNRIVEFNLSEL